MPKKAAKKLPKAVSDFLSAVGRKGGSVTGPTKARDSEKMRQAQLKRWEKHNQQKADEQARKQADDEPKD